MPCLTHCSSDIQLKSAKFTYTPFAAAGCIVYISCSNVRIFGKYLPSAQVWDSRVEHGLSAERSFHCSSQQTSSMSRLSGDGKYTRLYTSAISFKLCMACETRHNPLMAFFCIRKFHATAKHLNTVCVRNSYS